MLNYFGQILNLGLNNPLNSLVTVLSENNEPKHSVFEMIKSIIHFSETTK